MHPLCILCQRLANLRDKAAGGRLTEIGKQLPDLQDAVLPRPRFIVQDGPCLSRLFDQARSASHAACLGPVGGFAKQLLAASARLQQRDIGEFEQRDPQEAHEFDPLARRLDVTRLGRTSRLHLAGVGLLFGQRHAA